ncbi:MAG TPA: multifunctional CCA addition/repair protein [Woeseiaceae bacterium]|nr:multifunctional CCA addition/repair protein [Woeseiaceae bacterium]
MQIYLVGGAVRDELLGRPVTERDWCVVGATPEQMLQRGFRPVGKDFPVFLHPDTQEEYALARTERKTRPGYQGFAFHAAPDVSIEDDLARRDLTINAMAKDATGNIIDPFNGRADIDARILRHVSGAFVEDPVRVLRTAKFAARYHELGFVVADETVALMQQMVADGEVDALVPDRVWKETQAALEGDNARVFFETLRACAALGVVYPEIDILFGIPQPEKWHPEIDTGLHTMMVLEQAARLSRSIDVRFAALVHDLGKGTTAKSKLPSHPGHELRSVELIRQLAERLPIPKNARELGLLVAEFHTHCHRALELKATTVLKVLERTDAFRRPERFENFLLACEADAKGRTGFEQRNYPQADYFRQALATANSIDSAAVIASHEGPAIAEALRRERLAALQSLHSRSRS